MCVHLSSLFVFLMCCATGVQLLDPFTAVTASVDQRLSLWKLSLTAPAGVAFDLQIVRVRSVLTDVSDISSLAVVPKRCVCGYLVACECVEGAMALSLS